MKKLLSPLGNFIVHRSIYRLKSSGYIGERAAFLSGKRTLSFGDWRKELENINVNDRSDPFYMDTDDGICDHQSTDSTRGTSDNDGQSDQDSNNNYRTYFNIPLLSFCLGLIGGFELRKRMCKRGLIAKQGSEKSSVFSQDDLQSALSELSETYFIPWMGRSRYKGGELTAIDNAILKKSLFVCKLLVNSGRFKLYGSDFKRAFDLSCNEICEWMVKEHFESINEEFPDDSSLLEFLSREDRLDLLKLIDYSQVSDTEILKCLLLAITLLKQPMLEYLVDVVDPHLFLHSPENENKETMIMVASKAGNENAVRTLARANKEDVNCKDMNQMTALMFAVKLGYVSVVHALLENGADPDQSIIPNWFEWLFLFQRRKTADSFLSEIKNNDEKRKEISLLLNNYRQQDTDRMNVSSLAL